MNNNISIYENVIEEVQNMCSSISSDELRNMAVANALGVKIAEKVFSDDGIEIDSETGLYSIPSIAEKNNIADFYIKNSYVDVRVIFNENEIGVPKSHFDNNLLPSAYMFIKLSGEITDAEVLGYMTPENINTDNEINGYYPIDEGELVSYYDIEGLLNNPLDMDDLDEIQIYEYIDGTLGNKNEFLRKLIKSKKSRIKFKKILDAQKELQNALIPDESEVNTLEEPDEDFNISLVAPEVIEPVEAETIEDDSVSELSEIQEYSTVEGIDEPEEEIEDTVSEEYIQEYSSQEDYNEEIEDNTEDVDSDESDNQEYPDAEDSEPEQVTEDDLEELFDDENSDQFAYSTEVTESGSAIIESLDKEENSNNEEIQTLFEDSDNVANVGPAKRRSGAGKFFLFIIILALGGYWWYTNNSDSIMPAAPKEDNSYQEATIEEEQPDKAVPQEPDAMPVETVEQVEQAPKTEEGNAVSIPAIEQNLDASVFVSNLKVDWEVPAGYAANTSVKRYLVKVGKVIQLNLKTELLLLNKPPISNTVSVAIKFDDTKKKFEVIEITKSSGEKSVDDVILDTISNALAMNLSINTDSFGKLQGNPSIIIHF